MFHVAVCLCFVAGAFAAPAATDVQPLENQQPTVIPIVSQSEELEPNGTYKFSYETGNGIKREETSYDKVVPRAQGRSADSNEGGESVADSDEIHVQQGSYSYTAPDGTVISVRYIADENGFQPIGDHIPRVLSASFGSSAEKSGRALNLADSSKSASAPAAVAKSAQKDDTSAPAAPESGSGASAKPAESPAPAVAAESEPLGKSEEASTTEAVKATEAPSTEAASAEATTEVAKSSEASEVSTTEAVKTEAPEAPSTAAAEPSTTEAAATEAASTTAAA